MIRRVLMLGTMVFIATALSLAADLNGKWEGTATGPNGDIQLTFTFKVDGAALTGSVGTPNGDLPISDGKVNGDHISFNTHVGDDVVKHEGTISGDTIQLNVEGPWGKSEMKLTRAAKKPAAAHSYLCPFCLTGNRAVSMKCANATQNPRT